MKKDYLVMALIIGIVGGIAFISGQKSRREKEAVQPKVSGSSSDMSDHHKAPAPTDDSLFKSLLGKAAPDFTLESYKGDMVTLSDLKGKNVVLFFSEGAMCYPSCWEQVNFFVDQEKDFLGENAVVYTIVVDPRQEWKSAVDKEPTMESANVLLDAGGKVSSTYGALTLASSMHRGQYPGHTYLIINKEGIVVYEKDDPEMRIRNKMLLSELAKLN